jgi:hypothetical protein
MTENDLLLLGGLARVVLFKVGRRVDIMSHRNVEIVIGKLVTDEALRFEFRRRPASLLLRLADQGIGLTHYEVDAVLGLDVAALDRFAGTLDPRLEKAALKDLEDPFGLNERIGGAPYQQPQYRTA